MTMSHAIVAALIMAASVPVAGGASQRFLHAGESCGGESS
jgi:hypothetical protein